jgi:hypothetical protein
LLNICHPQYNGGEELAVRKTVSSFLEQMLRHPATREGDVFARGHHIGEPFESRDSIVTTYIVFTLQPDFAL